MLQHAYTSAPSLALLVGHQLPLLGTRASMHAMLYTLPYYFEMRLADFGFHFSCSLSSPGPFSVQPCCFLYSSLLASHLYSGVAGFTAYGRDDVDDDTCQYALAVIFRG